jgi:hypothetical protein
VAPTALAPFAGSGRRRVLRFRPGRRRGTTTAPELPTWVQPSRRRSSIPARRSGWAGVWPSIRLSRSRSRPRPPASEETTVAERVGDVRRDVDPEAPSERFRPREHVSLVHVEPRPVVLTGIAAATEQEEGPTSRCRAWGCRRLSAGRSPCPTRPPGSGRHSHCAARSIAAHVSAASGPGG